MKLIHQKKKNLLLNLKKNIQILIKTLTLTMNILKCLGSNGGNFLVMKKEKEQWKDHSNG